MSLIQRLAPATARLAHILAVRKANRTLATKWNIGKPILSIFFGGPVGDVYQVKQWLPVFEQIQDQLPSVLLVKDAVAALELSKTSPIPVRVAGSADSIESLAAAWGLKAMFYVNNNLANFSVLRLADLRHIHLSHGESEKASMTSNQLKAYDYCFVAGQASADRIMSGLAHFDPSHLKLIGRPQLDQMLTATPLPASPGRTTVLYAPTWEGDRPAMAYSSVSVAGERWVSEVLSDPGLRLIYRPHPKTGTRSKAVRGANRRIQKLIAASSAATPGAGHTVDRQPDYNPALASADIGLFDVSAMAMDFSVRGKPFLLSSPEVSGTALADSPLWNVARKIQPTLGTTITGPIHEALAAGPLPGALQFVEDHFGDVSEGSSRSRFANEIKAVL